MKLKSSNEVTPQLFVIENVLRMCITNITVFLLIYCLYIVIQIYSFLRRDLLLLYSGEIIQYSGITDSI